MVNNYVLYCSHNTYNLKCYLETDRQKMDSTMSINEKILR